MSTKEMQGTSQLQSAEIVGRPSENAIEGPTSDGENEDDRLALMTAASLNSLDSRPSELGGESSLTRLAHEDLKQRRMTIMNTFRIGSATSSASGSSRPNTGMSGHRGRTPLPYLIEKIVSKRANEL